MTMESYHSIDPLEMYGTNSLGGMSQHGMPRQIPFARANQVCGETKLVYPGAFVRNAQATKQIQSPGEPPRVTNSSISENQLLEKRMKQRTNKPLAMHGLANLIGKIRDRK